MPERKCGDIHSDLRPLRSISIRSGLLVQSLFPSTQWPLLQALAEGAKAISEICQQIQEWADKVGKPKRTELPEADTSLDEEVAQTSLQQEIKEQYLKTLGMLTPICPVSLLQPVLDPGGNTVHHFIIMN